MSTPLTKKSARILELDRVLALLANCAESEEAKALSSSLEPTADAVEARRLQDETYAAYVCVGRQGSPSFSGLKAVGAIVGRAGRGGVLSPHELLDVASLLRTARKIKAYAGEPKRELSCLDEFFSSLIPLKNLEDEIGGAILGPDEIADHASPELASIRKKTRLAAAKVREVLQKLVSSRSKALQEAIITQRGGRFVVPVKNEHKNDVPGLVHDVSASGATFFIEPTEVVNLNNEIRELEAAEQAEIERILAALSVKTAASGNAINENHDLLLSLDLIFARARLAYDMRASRPELSADGSLVLRRARHPLLDAKTAVPITLSLGESFDTLIITGPNTGGKTVALKTIGLLSLMAACGLHIPAGAGSETPIWDAVYADIGDEQSIEQSLSTFSSHMVNIVGILREAGRGCLVLFDELGAGTDPVEGAALAVSIIQHTRTLGAAIAATTHYAELKTFALTTDGVENASCEFDVETLRPTYRLLIGIPGKSNAFAISRRLGMPETIIENAHAQVGTENIAFEDVLSRLEQQRQALEHERIETQVLLRRTEENERRSAELRAALESQREKNVQRAQADARRIIEETRAEADEILAALRRMQAQGAVTEDVSALRARLNAAEDKTREQSGIETPRPAPITGPLKAGDTVCIVSMNLPATVLEPADRDRQVLLLAGMLKIKVALDDLTLAETEKPKKKPVSGTSIQRAGGPARMECDLRGMTGEEAVMTLEQFLDGAVMNRLETVTIIHGKGTGALRAAVQKALRQNKHIKQFRLGRYGEGESGVTIAELK